MIEFPKGARYFYLGEIGEPEGNVLRLVIIEAAAQGDETAIPGTLLSGQEIVPIPGARPIELVWEGYIAYAVRNESFAVFEQNQPSHDSMLSERSDSAFLAFVAKATWANAELPGPYKHWELVCLDHVVDVASAVAPIIRLR